MGIAELIPSISSATIALITGVYRELLYSIRALDTDTLRLLSQGKWKAWWQHINGSFLLPLILGIVTSLLSTLKLLRFLLTAYPIQIWSFFFGLMLISCITIYRQIRKFDYATLPISLLGALMAYGLIYSTPLQSPDSLWFITLAGAIAVCAMILPGISGSFMLLLLGKYTLMLDALQQLHWERLLAFLGGGILGLLSFSRVLNWLLEKHHDYTVALLAGFILGSLPKSWPWKQVILPLDADNLTKASIEQNISPINFQSFTQQDPLILEALLWMSLGCLVVVLLEKLAARQRQNQYFL